MTPNEADVKFLNYVQALGKRCVLFADTGGPQDGKPYITIKNESSTPLSHDVETLDTTQDEVISTVRGLSLVEYQVRALGGDASRVLNRLRNSFQSTHFLDKLSPEGFGFSECDTIIDISANFLESGIEVRYQLTCRFYISLEDDFEIDHFIETDVTVKVDDLNYTNVTTDQATCESV